MDENDEHEIEEGKKLIEKAIEHSLESTLGSFKKITQQQLVAMMGAMEVPKGHDDPIPMLATIDVDGNNVCHGFANFNSLPDTGARRSFMYSVGKTLSEEGQMIIMAYMGFFAWQALVTEEEMKKMEQGSSVFSKPSEDPNRQEILAFTGSTLIGQTATVSVPTNRNQFKPALDDTKFPPVGDIEIKYSTNKDTTVINTLIVAFWNGVINGSPNSDKD